MDTVFKILERENNYRIRHIENGGFYFVSEHVESSSACIIERNIFENEGDREELYWVYQLDMRAATVSDGRKLQELVDYFNETGSFKGQVPSPEALEEETPCPYISVRQKRNTGLGAMAEVVVRGESGDFYLFHLAPISTSPEEHPILTFERGKGTSYRYQTQVVTPIGVYEGHK